MYFSQMPLYTEHCTPHPPGPTPREDDVTEIDRHLSGEASTFLELARAVRRRTPGARFVMVGSTGTRIGRPDAP